MSHIREESPISLDPNLDTNLDTRLAARLAALRAQSGWSLDELAERTGISRATLSRLERGDTGTTTQLLSRLCTAYGLTMSRLLAEVERAPVRHLTRAQQPVWRDASSGFTRFMRSPPLEGFASELLEVALPAGTCIDYPQAVTVGLEHHLVLLEGQLVLTVDGTAHTLAAGDSLSFKLVSASRFESLGPVPARYFLVLTQPR